MNSQNQRKTPAWAKAVLAAAGFYHVALGIIVLGMSSLSARWIGIQSHQSALALWPVCGMFDAVVGVMLLLAARRSELGERALLVGILLKAATLILLPSIGVEFGLNFSLWLILHLTLWSAVFAGLLWSLFKRRHARMTVHVDEFHADDPLREVVSQHGESLIALSCRQPLLVVFLRHSGCTFCRESLADLQAQRSEIEQMGVRIAFVHMDDETQIAPILARHGLDDLPRFCDPSCRLYAQVGLQLGSFRQLFGLRVWLRGVKAGLIDGRGVGAVTANPLQMPGVFLMEDGRFLNGFQHELACERPDYSQLVRRANIAPVPVS